MILKKLYIIAIVMQISGAGIMALYYLKQKPEDIKKETSSEIDCDRGDAYTDYSPDDGCSKKYYEKYKNTTAFGLISVGYLIGIFAKQPEKLAEKYECGFWILIISIIVMILVEGVCMLWGNKQGKKCAR